jgi:CubicO group peptidase (beta-lactamase class C family)
VSTHAGLFGSIDDLACYGLQLRAQLRGLAGARVSQATAQLFAQRAIAREVGDWALGFMMPSPQGASCGRYFSPESIGHTGFTGTSIWYDPTRDLLVTILSNRVFSGRENKGFLTLRPQMHDWVVESL